MRPDVGRASSACSGRAETGESLPDIVAALGNLGPGALITEAGLARLLSRHPVSIRRAVNRGELPPPVRLLGKPTWTVGVLLRHIEERLENAAKEADKSANRIEALRP